MKRSNLHDLTVAELVERFAAIGMEQYKALLIDDNTTYKPLHWQMDATKRELKSRPGDQRRALIAFYDHPNMQVRLAAAKTTLGVAPKQARSVIESIAASRCFPQAGDAGMCLTMLDRGVFVPD
ncbi:MAG: DUF2019 domain-containing protein [Rhodomicrobium sp.]